VKMSSNKGNRSAEGLENESRASGARPGSPLDRRKTAGLSENEGALLSFSCSLQDGAAVLDGAGRIKGINRRFGGILGVSEQEIVGKRLDLIKTFRSKGLSRKLARLLSGHEVPPFEVETSTRTGQTMSLQIHLIHVRRAADPPKGAVVIIRDISDQRRLQQEFLAVDERSRLLVENADEGIAVIQDGKVVFVNQRAADLSGCAVEELLSKSFLHRIHPADRGVLDGEHVRSLKGEHVPRAYSFRVARPDGSVRWADASAVACTWQGSPAFLCFVKDITERKNVEHQLKESERRYRLLAENAADIIWVTDANLKITYASPSAVNALGYSLEEIYARSIDQLVTPESVALVSGAYRHDLAKEEKAPGTMNQRTLQLEAVRKDGSKFWVEAAVNVVRDSEGRFAGFQGACRDISKRKAAEEALREAKAKLDLLLQQMPCLSWTTDTELKFSSCAGGVIEAPRLGRLIGTRLADYYGADGRENPTLLSAHHRALAGTADSYEVGYRGRAFYCHVEPLRDAGNELAGVVGAAVDITDYKNMVSQLRTLSRRLISVQEAERRAIASELHDQVGQSLTALKLLLEKAQATAPEGDGQELAVAGGVVNELLTRVREMSLDLRPAMLDDLGLLPTLLWHFKHYTDQTQVTVRFRHAGLRKELPSEVSIAAYRIVQEALTNVARYAKVNEVSVCVRAERGVVVVEVADHGVGFDEARLASQPSSGLRGMRERSLALNGEFTVKSVPGRGTYVMAELPCGSTSRRSKEG
jgi:PAS domain S-box-containing protein